MVRKTKADDEVCAWRGCTRKPTRLITWPGGVQQHYCDDHADAALTWASPLDRDGAETKDLK